MNVKVEKDDDVIETDDSSVEEKKKTNVGKSLSVDMFERVDKQMKRMYSSDLRTLTKIDDRESKLIKKKQIERNEEMLCKIGKRQKKMSIFN